MIDNDRQLGLSMVGLGVEAFLDMRLPSLTASSNNMASVGATEFDCARRCARSRNGLIDLVNQGLAIVDIARQVVEMLERLRAPGAVSVRTDAHDHLDRLVGPGMLAKVGMGASMTSKRWVNGIRYRLQHLAGRVERDLAGMREVAPVERRFAERLVGQWLGARHSSENSGSDRRAAGRSVRTRTWSCAASPAVRLLRRLG